LSSALSVLGLRWHKKKNDQYFFRFLDFEEILKLKNFEALYTSTRPWRSMAPTQVVLSSKMD
ncbi:MAG: hypothetical protein AAFU60_10760, partial [Bacteroidota bacterium]